MRTAQRTQLQKPSAEEKVMLVVAFTLCLLNMQTIMPGRTYKTVASACLAARSTFTNWEKGVSAPTALSTYHLPLTTYHSLLTGEPGLAERFLVKRVGQSRGAAMWECADKVPTALLQRDLEACHAAFNRKIEPRLSRPDGDASSCGVVATSVDAAEHII